MWLWCARRTMNYVKTSDRKRCTDFSFSNETFQNVSWSNLMIMIYDIVVNEKVSASSFFVEKTLISETVSAKVKHTEFWDHLIKKKVFPFLREKAIISESVSDKAKPYLCWVFARVSVDTCRYYDIFQLKHFNTFGKYKIEMTMDNKKHLL